MLGNDFGYGMLDIFESVFNGSIEHPTLYGWRKVSRDKVLGDQLIDFDNSRNIDGSDYANHHDAKISQTFAYKWFYIAGKDNNKEAAIELIKLKNKMTLEEISVAEIAGDKKAKEIEDKSITRLPCAYD